MSARATNSLVGALALALVIAAVVLGEALNLAACALCVLQRLIHLTLATQALLAWPFGHWAARPTSLLMAGTAAGGAWAAGYQVWLQRMAAGISCTGEQPWWEVVVNRAGALWPRIFEANGFCNDLGWTFLGLSLADWSLLAFLAMTLLLLRAAFTPTKPRLRA